MVDDRMPLADMVRFFAEYHSWFRYYLRLEGPRWVGDRDGRVDVDGAVRLMKRSLGWTFFFRWWRCNMRMKSSQMRRMSEWSLLPMRMS
jgi:hypothetical protein